VRIVVDTNIAFSAILNTSSLIGEIIFNSEEQFKFFAPEFMEVELVKYLPKLKRATTLDNSQLNIAIHQVFKNIHFISHEAISRQHWEQAFELTKEVDEKDTPFLATTFSLKAILWTGDKKLISGLRGKGFNDIINTHELSERRI